MQTLATYTASFRAWTSGTAAYFLRSGAADLAQSRRAALASLGRLTRDEASLIAQGDHLALLGASLLLLLCAAFYLLHASHLFAAAR